MFRIPSQPNMLEVQFFPSYEHYKYYNSFLIYTKL